MNALVFVHGFMGGSAQWARQAPLAQGREIVALDLPGFGLRAGQPALASIANYGAWVLAELSRLGHAQFDLLGHSMGGMIAQEVVRQGPARVGRLILYGTGPVGVLPGRFEPIDTSIARAQADGPQATARRISATWFLHGEAAADYPACAKVAECAGLGAQVAGLRAMQGWNGQAALPLIAQPTLLIWGDQDRTYPWAQVQALWQGIANSQLAVVPGCAHAVHMEWPDLFNPIVAGFLAR